MIWSIFRKYPADNVAHCSHFIKVGGLQIEWFSANFQVKIHILIHTFLGFLQAHSNSTKSTSGLYMVFFYMYRYVNYLELYVYVYINRSLYIFIYIHVCVSLTCLVTNPHGSTMELTLFSGAPFNIATSQIPSSTCQLLSFGWGNGLPLKTSQEKDSCFVTGFTKVDVFLRFFIYYWCFLGRKSVASKNPRNIWGEVLKLKVVGESSVRCLHLDSVKSCYVSLLDVSLLRFFKASRSYRALHVPAAMGVWYPQTRTDVGMADWQETQSCRDSLVHCDLR